MACAPTSALQNYCGKLAWTQDRFATSVGDLAPRSALNRAAKHYERFDEEIRAHRHLVLARHCVASGVVSRCLDKIEFDDHESLRSGD